MARLYVYAVAVIRYQVIDCITRNNTRPREACDARELARLGRHFVFLIILSILLHVTKLGTIVALYTVSTLQLIGLCMCDLVLMHRICLK